jgi:hypothetical protein
MNATMMSFDANGPRSNATLSMGGAHAGLLVPEGLHAAALSNAAAAAPMRFAAAGRPPHGGRAMIADAPSFEAHSARSNAAYPMGSTYARRLAPEGLHAAALSKAAGAALTRCVAAGRSYPEAAE